MTSRTSVSPSSKTEWIISRSPASMSSLCSAMSTSSRSSASEANGPSRKPGPGVSSVADEDEQPRERPEHAGQRGEHRARRRARSRSACCRPRVRGPTPTATNVRAVIVAMATSDRAPAGAEDVQEDHGEQHGRAGLGEDAQERRDAEAWARDPRPSRASAAAPRRPSAEQLARACPGHPGERRLGRRQRRRRASTRTSATTTSCTSPALTTGPARCGSRGTSAAACAAGRTSPLLVRLGVVVAEQVQDAVRVSSRSSSCGASARPAAACARGDLRAEHDVAEQPGGRVLAVACRGAARPSGTTARRSGPGSSIHWTCSCSIAVSSTSTTDSSACGWTRICASTYRASATISASSTSTPDSLLTSMLTGVGSPSGPALRRRPARRLPAPGSVAVLAASQRP